MVEIDYIFFAYSYVHGLPVLGMTIQLSSSTNIFFLTLRNSTIITETHGNVSKNHVGRVIEWIFNVNSI